MKRIAYFLFLAAFISSCGPSHPLNFARIEFNNSESENYYLLSSRDSALTATRVAGSADSIETISFDRIHRIFLQGSTTGAEWLGFFGGFTAGFGIRQLVTTKNERDHDDGLTGVVVVPFIPIGVLIGNSLTDKLYEIDLNSPDGQEQLKKMLKYRNIK